MLDDTLNLIGDIEIFIAGGGAIVFAVSYATFFRWRKTAAGRALMYFVLSLVALFILNALGRWTGSDYPFREYIRFGTYSVLVFTIWRLVWVLWQGWRVGKERPLDIPSRQRGKQEKEQQMIWTKAFWKGAAERGIKTFAATSAALLGANGIGLLDVDFAQVGSVAGLATLVSVLIAIGNADFTAGESGKHL